MSEPTKPSSKAARVQGGGLSPEDGGGSSRALVGLPSKTTGKVEFESSASEEPPPQRSPSGDQLGGEPGEAQRQEVERLFRRYAPGIGAYLVARLPNADTAELLTSRVFLQVVRRWSDCHSNRVAWLWSIVRRELARWYREQRTDQQPLPEDLPAEDADPLAAAAQAEERQQLRAALAQLTPDQQTLIGLKFYLRLANTEIAETLGISANLVGVRLHRTLQQLRQLLESPRNQAESPGGRNPRARRGQP